MNVSLELHYSCTGQSRQSADKLAPPKNWSQCTKKLRIYRSAEPPKFGKAFIFKKIQGNRGTSTIFSVLLKTGEAPVDEYSKTNKEPVSRRNVCASTLYKATIHAKYEFIYAPFILWAHLSPGGWRLAPYFFLSPTVIYPSWSTSFPSGNTSCSRHQSWSCSGA